MSRLLLKKIIPFIKARYAPRGGRVTFSQYGEDLIIKDILQKKGLPLTYVDIGAHHPYFGKTPTYYTDMGEEGSSLSRTVHSAP